jgi:hypothetical protein
MDPAVAHHYFAHFFLFILITYVFFVIFWIIPLIQIARKAGLHYGVSLLTLLGPLGVLIAIYILAFAGWKRPLI